jgi:hypothetical protein
MTPSSAMPLPAIDALAFKGTHNSYQCHCDPWPHDCNPPLMGHPPHVQIDEFGVWAIELDVGIHDGEVFVGHDDAGSGVCDGYYKLQDFLIPLREARALPYRPILLYYEVESWSDDSDYWSTFGAARAVTEQVFGAENVLLLHHVDGPPYPSVRELAGKLVIYYPLPEYGAGGQHAENRSGSLVSRTLKKCASLEDAMILVKAGCVVVRADQYQADWTFDYGVPPNPLVVNSAVKPPWRVRDARGEEWSCDNGDVWNGQWITRAHGTFRFPYKTISDAVSRAQGETSLGAPKDARRSGYGWTLLIAPGHYPEAVIIGIPLTLKKDDRLGGDVIIGR